MTLRKPFWVSLAVGAATLGSAAAAQTNGDYGSAILQTKRNCPTTAATACDGAGAGQGIVQRQGAGGSGKAATSTYTATGTGAGSTAFGSVSFGAFGFPEIKASVNAKGDVRVGNNIYSYQSYTYTGAAEFDLLLAANFHIVNSSTDGSDGAYPGGARASAGFAIWDRDDFFSYASDEWVGSGGFSTAASLYNQGYLFGANVACAGYSNNVGGPSPWAISSTTRSLSGGETSLAVAQQNCAEDTLTLYQGDEFVIATYAQLAANRNAFVDATGTFTLGLDPNMDAADIAAFQSGVTFATTGSVPEPATWAMMITGFGLVGAAMRRRTMGAIRAGA